MQTAGELRHHTSWWQREQMTQHPTWPVKAEGSETWTRGHPESQTSGLDAEIKAAV